MTFILKYLVFIAHIFLNICLNCNIVKVKIIKILNLLTLPQLHKNLLAILKYHALQEQIIGLLK